MGEFKEVPAKTCWSSHACHVQQGSSNTLPPAPFLGFLGLPFVHDSATFGFWPDLLGADQIYLSQTL